MFYRAEFYCTATATTKAALPTEPQQVSRLFPKQMVWRRRSGASRTAGGSACHYATNLQGFDRDTDKLVARFTIPKSSEHTVKVIAGILPSHDGLGDYPLDQKQIAQIALVLRDTQCSAGTSYLLVGIPTGSATGQPSEEVSLMS
jgi:hypothetical protein